MQTITRTALTLLTLLPLPALASPDSPPDALTGKKHLFLVDARNNEIPIGNIQFTPSGAGVRYQLHMEHEQFKDFFLSMKEMKCLEGPELMCHLPYPYEQPRTITPDDLSWLSHDLLFMYKKPNEFGANFWNGIYFDMRLDAGVIKGEAQAVDLNLLAAPPDDLTVPPVNEGERDEIDVTLRWLPYIVIR